MQELAPEQIDTLVQHAINARQMAYAPHSQFDVGAAVWIPEGAIVTGCNVENASYGLTICAERAAICTAVNEGYQQFQAIAIATAGGAYPCGACRQFLSEFRCDLQVIMVDVLTGARQIRRLSQLLPDAFDADNLPIH